MCFWVKVQHSARLTNTCWSCWSHQSDPLTWQPGTTSAMLKWRSKLGYKHICRGTKHLGSGEIMPRRHFMGHPSFWGCGNMELFLFWGTFNYFISSARHDISFWSLWNQTQVIKRSRLRYFSWFSGFFKGGGQIFGVPKERPKYWNLFVESCSEKSFVHVFTVFGFPRCLWQCLKFGQEIYCVCLSATVV